MVEQKPPRIFVPAPREVAEPAAALATGPVGRYIRRSLRHAALIWCVLFTLGEFAVYRASSAGTPYVFAPRGWGIPADAATHILGITFFLLLNTLPSFMARRWLGATLRVLMFGLFVVFLTSMQFVKIVAVVETADHKTIFYPHYPLAPRVYAGPPNADYRQNDTVSQLCFYTERVDDLNTYPVYRCDTKGSADLERFASHVCILQRRR